MVIIDPYLLLCTKIKYSRWVKEHTEKDKMLEVSQENKDREEFFNKIQKCRILKGNYKFNTLNNFHTSKHI